MPRRVLAVALAWTIVLVALFILFEEVRAIRTFFPTKLGPLPFTSIWFGAAGGLLISLQGIFNYNRRWRRSYDYWHYLRPVIGGMMGTLGCLVFIVLNQAASTQHPPANGVFYAVLAFVLGYREQSFRALVMRLVDTIILPPDKTSGSKATSSAADS
jgi:H+/Cl- antiporter ClcA